MADNVTYTTTLASPPDATVVATDDVGSAHYQRVKIDLGGDGLASPLIRGQLADATSIPVTLSTEQAAFLDGIEGTLTSIKTAVEIIDNMIAGSEGQVDVVTSALPTGASTLAEQQTQTASLSVLDDWDETDRAKVNVIVGQAGIAAGTGVDGVTVPRVTLATNVALPAGTNGIGKLTANSGVDIGDVDVTSVIPGTGATNLGKPEDGPHTTGDVGVMALAVRQDAQADFGADGDYVPFSIDADGQLRVTGSVAGTQYAEDTVSSAADLLFMAGVVRKDTAATLVDTDGDRTQLQVDANGRLHVLPASHAVTNAGTFAVQDAAAEASLSVLDDWDNAASDGASVSGDVAHDSADAGEPVKVGAKAYSPDGTTPGTAVAEADRSNLKTDLDGLLFVNPSPPTAFHYHDDDTAAVTTDGTLAADPGDGFSVFIKSLTFSIGAATASSIFVEEGATKILGPYYLEAIAGRGCSIVFDPPKRCTASTAILVTNTGSITFAIDCDGYVSAI